MKKKNRKKCFVLGKQFFVAFFFCTEFAAFAHASLRWEKNNLNYYFPQYNFSVVCIVWRVEILSARVFKRDMHKYHHFLFCSCFFIICFHLNENLSLVALHLGLRSCWMYRRPSKCHSWCNISTCITCKRLLFSPVAVAVAGKECHLRYNKLIILSFNHVCVCVLCETHIVSLCVCEGWERDYNGRIKRRWKSSPNHTQTHEHTRT